MKEDLTKKEKILYYECLTPDFIEAWIHGGAGFRTDKVGWQKAIDGLAWLGESTRGVFANVPGAQCEEDREESA